jgi:hypothetical protein
MFPVRYELSFYILITRYSVFKGLIYSILLKGFMLIGSSPIAEELCPPFVVFFLQETTAKGYNRAA